MPRFLLVVLATALLILPATAEGQSTSSLRGTVALKSQTNDLVTLRTQRQRVALRVRSSMSRIRIGQRVELRGSTLRAQGSRSGVLARNVFVVSSGPLSSPSSSPQADDDVDDDEVEIKGRLMSLGSSVTVESATRSVTCVDPTGISAKGFVRAELVEMTCDRVAGGALVVRKLEHEDDNSSGQGIDDDDHDADEDEDDDDDSGPGGDDGDDSSGHGPGGNDDD